MSHPGSERRRHLRAQVPGLQATLNSPGDARVLDVSLSGLSLEVPGELEPGDRCFLELRHEGRTASIEVEVRWASVLRIERVRSSLVPVFRAGVAFLDILADGTGGLLDWLVVEPLPARARG